MYNGECPSSFKFKPKDYVFQYRFKRYLNELLDMSDIEFLKFYKSYNKTRKKSFEFFEKNHQDQP